MTTVSEWMTVTAIVKSRAEEADGWAIKLDIPSFRSDYPTDIDRIPPALAEKLPPRQEFYSLVLQRKGLKKGKDGHLPWHYYWKIEGLATPEEAKAGQQAEAAMGAPSDAVENRDFRIWRSVALTQAVAYVGPGSTMTPEEVTQIGDVFYAWLNVPDPAIAALPESLAPSAEAEQSEQSAVLSNMPELEGLVTKDKVIAWAKTIGYPDARAMAAVPGVTEAMKGEKFYDAITALKAAKETEKEFASL